MLILVLESIALKFIESPSFLTMLFLDNLRYSQDEHKYFFYQRFYGFSKKTCSSTVFEVHLRFSVMYVI